MGKCVVLCRFPPFVKIDFICVEAFVGGNVGRFGLFFKEKILLLLFKFLYFSV